MPLTGDVGGQRKQSATESRPRERSAVVRAFAMPRDNYFQCALSWRSVVALDSCGIPSGRPADITTQFHQHDEFLGAPLRMLPRRFVPAARSAARPVVSHLLCPLARHTRRTWPARQQEQQVGLLAAPTSPGERETIKTSPAAMIHGDRFPYSRPLARRERGRSNLSAASGPIRCRRRAGGTNSIFRPNAIIPLELNTCHRVGDLREASC